MIERLEIWLQAAVVALVLLASVAGMAIAAARPAPAPVAVAPTVAPPDEGLIASTAPSVLPTATAVPVVVTLTPAPAPTAAATPRPPLLTAYAYGPRSYTGVQVEPGVTVLAPFGASLEIHVYQLVGGEIREGVNAAGVPYFPYVILHTADRRMTFRPGELDRDAVLIARDGPIAAGDPLFRVVGSGSSSWATFYDSQIPFQIVVSLVTVPQNSDLDAAPFLRVQQ